MFESIYHHIYPHGYFPTHRRLSSPRRRADAGSQDPLQPKRTRTELQDSRDLPGGLRHALLGSAVCLAVLLPLCHEDPLHLPYGIHHLPHADQEALQFGTPFSTQSYDVELDKFPHYFIYLGALVLSIAIHRSFNPLDFMWSFSMWLEAGAILPQLSMISKLKEVENITAHYVFFLGLYRLFYVLHW